MGLLQESIGHPEIHGNVVHESWPGGPNSKVSADPQHRCMARNDIPDRFGYRHSPCQLGKTFQNLPFLISDMSN